MRSKYILIVLFSIGLLELGLRATGIYRTITEKRGSGFYTDYGKTGESWLHTWTPMDSHLIDHKEFQYTYYPNSYGYRDREPEWSDSADIRLMAIGDSFTEGMGAAVDSTWPRHLSRIMQNAGQHIEVLNMGMSGSDPFFSYMELVQRSLDIDPSHVILMVNSSDLDDYTFRHGMERFLPDGTVRFRDPPAIYDLYKYSHFMRFVLGIAGYNQQLYNRFTGKKQMNNAYADINLCLKRIADSCAVRDIEFMTVYMPMPHELCYQSKYRIDGFQNDTLPFDNVLLTRAFENYFNEHVNCAEQNYFWPMDGHFTGRGYRLLAQLVYDAISESHPNFWQTSQMETAQ